MSKHKKYQPKHAALKTTVLHTRTGKVVRTTVLASGVVSVTLTGASVAGGVLADGPSAGNLDASLAAAGIPAKNNDTAVSSTGASTAPSIATRRASVSRSADRTAEAPAKASLLNSNAGTIAQREVTLDDADPRDIAKALLPKYGFSASEFGCLDKIWSQESGWRVDADNPTSSAYGIPQGLTATHAMPEGYMTSAEVQITWGLDYIANRYGTPCNAWGFKSGHGWY